MYNTKNQILRREKETVLKQLSIVGHSAGQVRHETRDVRQETGDRRHETGGLRQEM